MLSPPSDVELVHRCVQGEATAWNAIVDRYSDLIYGIARRAGLDGPAGEDVVQEVFMALAKNIRRFRQGDRLMGWLVKSARRRAWREARRMRVLRDRDAAGSRPDRDPSPSPQAAVQEEERRHLVRRAMAQLGPPCRALLDALFLREAPDYRTLSQQLGIPVGSIGPQRKRCLAKLLPLLESLGIRAPAVSDEAQPRSRGSGPGRPPRGSP